MKTDGKVKAQKSPPKTKAVKPNGRAVPKTNGKHPLAAYEHIPVGIVEASLDGKYMDVNEEFCRILGYARKELLRRGIKDCTHEDDYSVDYTLYKQLVTGKIPFYRLEKRYVRKDGSSIWVELTRSIVKDAKGKPLHTVGVVLDISDRKDVEKVLRDSVERLRLATGAAQMFMWEWDFEAQSYTIADNYEQVLGFSAGLLPKNKFETIWALSPREDVQLISDGFQKAVENQSDLHALPCRIINPENGQIVWLEISAKIVYDRDGTPERMFGVAQNITENKNAQDQIVIISRMPEENPNPVMRLAPDGRIMYTNSVSAALLEDWVQGGIPEELHNKITLAFHSGVKTEVEIRNRERIFSFTLAPVVEGGYVNLYGRNITERKQMEQALRESEERYRRIVETANEGIWEIDRDTCTTFVNPRMAQMLGYTAEEMAGRSSFDFVFPEDNDEGERRLVRAKSGAAKSDEFRFRRKDGSPLWALVSTSPQLDEHGNFLGSIALVADITERKQLEDTLRESEERFRAMVSQTTAGIAESDLDSQLVFVNPGFCEILGYSEAELLGKTIWELTYTQDLEENKRLFKRMLEEGESYQFEKRFIRKDGSLLWASVSVTTIYDLAGKPKGGVGVILDIETRKQAESALAEYARQQESLYHLSDQLLRTESLADVFNAALDAILNALQCDRASILLFDPMDVMRFVAWRGLSDAYRKATDGHSPWKRDAKDPQPISMGDVRTADLDESLRSIILDEGIGSLAFIPLVVNGTLIGKFMIYFDVPHTFDDAELDFSMTIAHQLASGIDRKRAEEALRESEQKFTLIYENLPFAAALAKPETGIFVDVNQEFEKVFGYSKQDIIGKTSFELGINPQVEVREQVLKELQQYGSARNVEVELFTRAGEVRSFINNIDIVSINEEKYILSTLQEITERKQTEKRLVLMAEISEMLRNFDDPHALMYSISVAVGQHLHVKRALFNEIDLEHDREIVHRDYHNDLESVAGVHKVSAYSSITSQEVAAGKTVVNMDSKIDPRTAQDYEKTYAVSRERAYVAVPLMRDNRWMASFWVSDDVPRQWTSEEVSLLETVAERTWAIIEKLRINTALRESEQRFRGIFETAGVSVWVQDFTEVRRAIEELRDQGIRDFPSYFKENRDFVRRAIQLIRIVDVNNETVELFKARDKAELLQSLDKIFVPETELAFIEELIALAEGREMVRAETTEQTLDGQLISVIFTVHFGPGTGDLSRVVVTLTDITERKQTEEALRASEERMRLATDAAGMYTWEFNVQNQIFTASDNFDEVLGIPADLVWENNMQALQQLSPAEDAEIVQDALQKAFENQDDLRDLQYRIVNPESGQVVWVEVNARTIYDREGKPERMYGVSQNITDRKRIEDALRKSEERYRFIVENTSDGIWQVELTTPMPTSLSSEEEQIDWYYKHAVMRQCNLELARMYGYKSVEELVGLPIQSLMPREIPENLELTRQFIRSGYRLVDAESREVSVDGRELVFLNSMVGMIENGRLVGEWGTNRDITERKRAEEALRASESLYRAIARSIPGGGVYVVDKDFRYLVAEGPVTKAFGLSREMLEGHTVTEVFPDERGRRMEHRLRQNFAGESVDFETSHNGRVYWTQQAPLYDSIGQAIILTLDITERKRAEEALRQSEERFAQFMQHLPGLAWIKDVEGRYIYANAAAEKAFRTPREILYGRTDEEIFPAEVAAQFSENDRLALSDEKGVQVIETLEQDDGLLHYSLVSKFPISGPDGKTLIGGTAFDITERRQAEEALRESEERFRAILRQATAGIVRKDAQGRLLFVNEAFCNMLSYTELELTGKTIWEFMHPDDLEENRRSYERLMQEGIPFKLERRFLRQDGTVIWVDASVSPIMDSTGKPQSAVAVEVDITGRKLAEEALQQLNAQLEDRVLNRTAKLRAVNQTLREEISERQRVEQALRQSEAVARANEEKLSTLFELLPVGISFLDPEGQIIQVNPALESIMKLPKEQLSDQAYRSRHYIRANGTTMPPAEFASQRALTEGKIVYNVETGVVLEDGEVIWTSVSAAPVNVAEVGAVVVTADITESKRAERALQESRERLQILSQRLVEVQEEERRAIARELHDRVGQTLAALNINLIIISGQLSGKVDEQISTRLNDSMKLVAETIALVRDVMSNLRPSVLDDYGLEAAIDSQLNQFTSRYEIGVKFEKPSPPIPRLGPSVEMTFLRIAQEALMNIARHAQATQVHLRLWQEDHTICMTVQDNGTGISSWQDANRPGSHGLTIMRERAEAFGGNLKVSSVPGKGTKVEVKIPIETNDPSQIMEGRPE